MGNRDARSVDNSPSQCAGYHTEQERAGNREKENCVHRRPPQQADLVAALAHGDVRVGRNLSDRHAGNNPTANCQKDKKGKHFPHIRLRSGWVD